MGPGAYAPFSVESQLPELLADPAAFNAAHDVFYMSWPGGHEWQPWRKSLYEFCQMIFR